MKTNDERRNTEIYEVQRCPLTMRRYTTRVLQSRQRSLLFLVLPAAHAGPFAAAVLVVVVVLVHAAGQGGAAAPSGVAEPDVVAVEQDGAAAAVHVGAAPFAVGPVAAAPSVADARIVVVGVAGVPALARVAEHSRGEGAVLAFAGVAEQRALVGLELQQAQMMKGIFRQPSGPQPLPCEETCRQGHVVDASHACVEIRGETPFASLEACFLVPISLVPPVSSGCDGTVWRSHRWVPLPRSPKEVACVDILGLKDDVITPSASWTACASLASYSIFVVAWLAFDASFAHVDHHHQ